MWATAWFFSVAIIGGISLSLILVYVFGLPEIIMWVGIPVFFITPLLFRNQIVKIFTKKATVSFSNDFFSIDLFNIRTGDLEKECQYNFNEIETYKIAESTKDDGCYSKLNFINGTKADYTFYRTMIMKIILLVSYQNLFVHIMIDK
jgi:hypothetical protein